MRLNVASKMPQTFTHEGAPAKCISNERLLRRSVLSCLLWERELYEDGIEIADRIVDTATKVDKQTVSDLAAEAREQFGMRHAPLLLLLDLIRRGGSGVAETVAATIRRADEITELVAMYWRGGKRPLSKQMKLGLAMAFDKFDAYQFAKYSRPGPVQFRDVLFLTHAKPRNEAQEALFKGISEKALAAPDTWEVGLSTGGDKRETFERLLREGKLGYLALLRNLRNMFQAGVDESLMREAILARKGADRIWPFRYVAAARAVPQLEPIIDQALTEAVANGDRLAGKTIVLVDVSSSMSDRLSARSDMTRMDAAAALASVLNADVRVFSFSAGTAGWHDRRSSSPVALEVPARRGMAGIDAVINSQYHGGTRLGQAVSEVNPLPHDRLIVITDEQSFDPVPDPVAKRAYMINVASARNGVGYGRWIHVDGFSEAVIRYISEIERLDG
ncbi:MAG: TROVE domain-containing protein [Pseudomonadota bacterium]